MHAFDLEDEFGDVDDAELLLAESIGNKRKASPDFDQEPSVKKPRKGEDVPLKLAQKILKDTWGFPDFKHEQEAAITRLISGRSAAVIFPTGGGKSLVYQIPALTFNEYDESRGRVSDGGVTLVVSPLIALMKDQVDALKKRGVAAAAMDSTQSRESWLETCEALRIGRLKLLYVAPERLNNEGFIEIITHTKVRMVAVDEAHCISEWGHAFRPDYLKVARFTKEVQAERVLCLTATATENVIEDICKAFDIDKEGVFKTATYRPNLWLLAESFASAAHKAKALKKFLQEHKGPSIVYVQTHEQTEIVTKQLIQDGFNAHGYHAGMKSEDRTLTQEKFMKGTEIIIVATIAFGMGIDKYNIRNIIHYALPKSLEGYSQEIGRAGRDNKESFCMIYLCDEDIGIMEQWSRADVPSLRSVTGLVGELIETCQHSMPEEVIERHLNEEGKEWDLKRGALDLLNAQLELRFELIRAITPRYSVFKFIKSRTFSQLTSDNSKLTTALKKNCRTLQRYTIVDVDSAASMSGCPRADAVRKLQEWNDRGAIELTPSGVINRFRILKRFPQTEGEKCNIANAIHAQFEERERSDMDRVQKVISLITAADCMNLGLAKYFGSDDAVPRDGCGHCNFCITKKPVVYHKGRASRKGRIDDAKIKAIWKAVKIHDDPRFMARVAFGIGSPRVTAEGLGKQPVFGSMTDCEFEELVQRFTQMCAQA